MGGPNRERRKPSRTQEDGNSGLVSKSEGWQRRPLRKRVELISLFMHAHTHAGFTHSKNRPRLSTGPVLARCVKIK